MRSSMAYGTEKKRQIECAVPALRAVCLSRSLAMELRQANTLTLGRKEGPERVTFVAVRIAAL